MTGTTTGERKAEASSQTLKKKVEEMADSVKEGVDSLKVRDCSCCLRRPGWLLINDLVSDILGGPPPSRPVCESRRRRNFEERE